MRRALAAVGALLLFAGTALAEDQEPTGEDATAAALDRSSQSLRDTASKARAAQAKGLLGPDIDGRLKDQQGQIESSIRGTEDLAKGALQQQQESLKRMKPTPSASGSALIQW